MRKTNYLLLSLTLMISFLLPVSTHAATDRINPDVPYDYSLIFDWEYYYHTYSDLQQSIGTDADALFNHFITTGMKEGRSGNADFQVKAYMYNNLDLLSVYGAGDLSPYYVHYMTCGKKEGRKANFTKNNKFPEDTLASYTTLYSTSEERAVNVELAAVRINGVVIEPGKSFSFSDSVGTRTVSNGYVIAPSYASGKIVTSVGGGICQVSSTLYVAMLLSGIPATEHYFHSLPVDYVPTGLDAAIVEGYKDLRFTNPYDYPITVSAVANNGTLTVSLVKSS